MAVEWRDKARAFAAGGSAVVGATELQRLLVLTDQLPKLSSELLAKAESKVDALRSELKRLIVRREDAIPKNFFARLWRAVSLISNSNKKFLKISVSQFPRPDF